MTQHGRDREEVEAIRHTLSFYGWSGGYRAGTFTEALMLAISKADMGNRMRLRQAYPILVDTMVVVMDEVDAENKLRVRLVLLLGPDD